MEAKERNSGIVEGCLDIDPKILLESSRTLIRSEDEDRAATVVLPGSPIAVQVSVVFSNCW